MRRCGSLASRCPTCLRSSSGSSRSRSDPPSSQRCGSSGGQRRISHSGATMTGPGVVTTETMQPDLAETGQVQEKQPPKPKSEPSGRAVFRVWRGDRQGGKLVDYATTISPGMVVLDVIHQIQAEQANDLAVRWNCKAGKCGSCSAEVNGSPRLMCMTRLSELPLERPVTVEPM